MDATTPNGLYNRCPFGLVVGWGYPHTYKSSQGGVVWASPRDGVSHLPLFFFGLPHPCPCPPSTLLWLHVRVKGGGTVGIHKKVDMVLHGALPMRQPSRPTAYRRLNSRLSGGWYF